MLYNIFTNTVSKKTDMTKTALEKHNINSTATKASTKQLNDNN